MARVGFFVLGTPATHTDALESFKKGMRELGYAEGKNVIYEMRWGGGNPDALAGLAAELVKWSPDVILVAGTAVIRAARNASPSTPLVMASAADPVEAGFATSLAHPGGSITGITNMAVDTSTKLVELAREVSPKAARAAVLLSGNVGQRTMFAQAEKAAKQVKLDLVPVTVRSMGEIEAALTGLAGKVDIVIFLNDSLFFSNRQKIAGLLARSGLPSVFARSEHVDAGGLLGYSSRLVAQYHRAAAYVDKILRGARPGDLPIERPTAFELVLNMRTAKTLGIPVPQPVLLRADRVIE